MSKVKGEFEEFENTATTASTGLATTTDARCVSFRLVTMCSPARVWPSRAGRRDLLLRARREGGLQGEKRKEEL